MVVAIHFFVEVSDSQLRKQQLFLADGSSAAGERAEEGDFDFDYFTKFLCAG